MTKTKQSARARRAEEVRRRWVEKQKAAATNRDGQGSPQNGAQSNGHELSPQAASDGLDLVVERAVSKSGCKDLAAFRKLPASEQNAFLAQARSDAKVHPENVAAPRNVAIDLLVPSPWNRDIESEAKANGEEWQQWVGNIQQHGIIQPLIVRPLPEGRFQIIAGERRWRGAKAAKLATAPILIRTDLSDADVLEMQTIENYQRRGLNPIEEAQKFQQLLDQPGYTMERLCAKIGLKKNTVYGKLKLLGLPPEGQQAVIKHKLPASHAELIARQETPEMQAALTKLILHPGQHAQRDGDVLSLRSARYEAEQLQQREKNREAYEKERDRVLKIPGARVLTDKESEKARYGDAYVELADRAPEFCESWKEEHTWKELLKGGTLPPPVLIKDHEGEPLVQYERLLMIEAAEANGHQQKSTTSPGPNGRAADSAAAKRKREKAKISRVVWRESLRQLVAAVERGGDSETVWRFIALDLLEHLCGSSRRAGEVIERRDLGEVSQKHSPRDILRGHANKGFSARQLRGLCVEAIAWKHEPYDYGHGISPEFVKLCALWAVDVKAIEAGMRTPAQSSSRHPERSVAQSKDH